MTNKLADLIAEIDTLQHGNIAVLLGGASAEREVSLLSGNAILEAFSRVGIAVTAIDTNTSDLASKLDQHAIKHCFIALHGGDGENGTVQAVLKSKGISFTGSDMTACAIAMDKAKTKLLWQGANIATAPFTMVSDQSIWQDVSASLGNKMMLKPVSEGSSIGMSIVDSEESFYQAISDAAKYDSQIIAEKWIDGPEYTVAILNGVALPMIKMQTNNAFYDYQAKYLSNETQYLCPCGLTEDVETQIKREALAAFNILGCSGWGRVDVMLDQSGQHYFLEANTVPGMTSHSLVPMAAEQSGFSFDALVLAILLASLRV